MTYKTIIFFPCISFKTDSVDTIAMQYILQSYRKKNIDFTLRHFIMQLV